MGGLTDYMRYLGGMADLIGCAPRFATLLFQPALWFRARPRGLNRTPGWHVPLLPISLPPIADSKAGPRWQVLVGPLTAAQFRLHGPGAQPKSAEAAIRAMPLMPWPVLLYELMLLIGCKTLAVAGASRFSPLAF